jgi:arylsulfatase A-like enzyme
MPGEPKHKDVHLPDDEVTMADVLKGAGYKTALVGKWHLGHGSIEYGPNEHGFDEFFGFLPGCIDYYEFTYEQEPALYRNKELVKAEGYSTDVFTDEAIRFIEANRSGPFFLYLAHNAPHYGRTARGKFLQLPPEGPDYLPKETDWDLRVYKEMVKNLDMNTGKLLDALKRLGLEEDTIVIFLSDNGADYKYGGSNLPWKGAKGNLWDGGIRVPFMIRWKGRIKAGQQRRQLAVNFDLLPTLTHFAGASLPERKLDGVDLYDIIMNNAEAPQRSIFFERKPKGQIAVRSNKWKYLQYPDGREFLFDEENDMYERVSVFEDHPEQAKVQAEKMKADFGEFIKEFED